jgi:hypothetical protein
MSQLLLHVQRRLSFNLLKENVVHLRVKLDLVIPEVSADHLKLIVGQDIRIKLELHNEEI